MCCCCCCITKWIRDQHKQALLEGYYDSKMAASEEIGSYRRQIMSLETTLNKAHLEAEKILLVNENDMRANFYLMQCAQMDDEIQHLNQQIVKLNQLCVKLDQAKTRRITKIQRQSFFRDFFLTSLSYFNDYRNVRDEDYDEELLPVTPPVLSQQPVLQPVIEEVQPTQAPQPQPAVQPAQTSQPQPTVEPQQQPLDPMAIKMNSYRENILRGTGGNVNLTKRDVDILRTQRRQLEEFNNECFLDELTVPSTTPQNNNGDNGGQ
jgi:hypothetical protein